MEAFCFFLHLLFLGFVCSEVSFTYEGFHDANLSLYGAAYMRSDGILVITKDSTKLLGHALYPSPLRFKESKLNNSSSIVVTFSTNFVFSMKPQYPELGGHGLAFVLFSTKEPKGCLPSQYLGLPNDTSNAQYSTRVLAIEFDTVQNFELQDINDNHVGIDISSLTSNISEPAAFYLDNSTNNNKSISLKSGGPFQVWIDYDSLEMVINVTIAPLALQRPYRPLISFPIDLSPVLDEQMYVGFSASTGLLAEAHNLLGWSFRIGGRAQDLDISELPSLVKPVKVVHKKGFALGITLASVTLVFLFISGAIHVKRRIENMEALEDWEVEYGARRFKYSDLVAATGGFGERNLIGTGGFGKVYKGIVPSTGLEVAIKRIAQDSRQGMKEFVAEITSMGRLRHRNLVQLHGWCRRQDDLLLVYDYVPHGSLDDVLFDNPQQKKKKLTWEQRYKILIGVAQALLYLHEECEQLVLHRDVKPSNVLIDADLNAKLGDFGLARINQHGIHPQTTHVVGTLGYLAPELTRTGKATTSTDVYSYGALMLEVASGRRPIEPQRSAHELVLVDWVRELHSRGEIVQAIDPTMDEYNPYEAELVLGLGLLCSHSRPDYRPSMRRAVQVLLGDASLPQLPPDFYLEATGVATEYADFYADDSDPSCGKASSSMATNFSSFDKKVSSTQATRATP
ncbi:hypothetical protein RJ640_009072 [Escallonia rubra]|uniref:non-specific serine/threonine protein kinase n=1 Tax=Escallonia rubra TaxID=112253 RepID=A0AA88RCI9_9ASTE|nr:hypothetical protein RJ640_009072 [Escallonia rubra]